MLAIIKKILEFFGVIESEKSQYLREKGEQGESRVTKVFSDVNVKTLNNLYLPNYYGYTEIDLLIITKVGVFVGEVKNYNNCSIYGEEDDEKWVIHYNNGKKYDMYNTIKQNDGHIKTLFNYVNSSYHRIIYSLIVFSDNTDLQIKTKRNGLFLINEKQLESLITKLNNSKPILSNNDINIIYNSLKQYTNAPEHIKKQHVKNVKTYVKKKGK